MDECKWPKLIQAKGSGKKLIRARCRKCLPCLKLRQQQWQSRLLYEQAYTKLGNPLFVTLTYEQEPENEEDFKNHYQSFTRRIRDRGYSIRYFAATERGSKTGRFHAHVVLWSDLPQEKYMFTRNVLTACWKQGHVLLRRMYGGRKGFNYACKYLFKQQGYATWSRRPGLGRAGMDDFIERAIDRYTRTGRLIDRMRIPVLAELLMVRVHSGWMRTLRKRLGIRRIPNAEIYYLEGDTKPETYLEARERILTPSMERKNVEKKQES